MTKSAGIAPSCSKMASKAIYRAMFIHLSRGRLKIHLPELIEELERLAITCALAYSHNNAANAAKTLGLRPAELSAMRLRLGLPTGQLNRGRA